MRYGLLAVILLGLSARSEAHHSFAPYRGTETRALQGEVVSVLWRNPHITLELRTVDAEGSEEIWLLEGSPVVSLRRQGVPDNAVAIGDQIEASGLPSNLRDRQMLMRELSRDGEIILGGETAQAEIPDERIAANRESASGIFRVWSRVPGTLGLVSWADEFQLRDAASTKQLEWDQQVDDSALRCIPPGMPRAMALNPRPIEFVDNNDSILLHLEEFDGLRTIHLAGASSTEIPFTPLGYSVGRWEEQTLIVVTSRIDYPFFNRDGIPQSKDVRVAERFSLSPDGSELTYEIEVTDPQTFVEPAVGSTTWVWDPGVERQTYDCAFLE